MKRKKLIIGMLFLAIVHGCVKETYDMDKLSGEAEVSPTIAFPVFKGLAVLSDAVKESDTVIYDSDNFVRLIYRQDSVVDLELKDYINTDELVSFNDAYTIGEISIAPFQGTMAFSLNEVTMGFPAVLRNQFLALDDGLPHPFPPFPSITMGNKTFTAFPNFERAVFSSGTLDIAINNHFDAPLNGLQVTLTNSAGTFAVLSFPQVNPNTTVVRSINLAGKTLTNSLTASVTITGSPGNAVPAVIDLDNDNISLTANGRDLKVSSGRVIVPSQFLSNTGDKDTVSINPGDGMELDKLRLISGTLNWESTYNASLRATVNITLPSVIRDGVPFTQPINVNQAHSQGSIALQNTTFSFSADPKQPYNKLPISYNVRVNSENILVDFRSTDQIQLSLSLSNAEFDYIKGYFGQQVESVTPDTIDFGIEEYMRNVSGDFFLANPTVRFNYSNSFGIPIEVALNGQGMKGTEKVSLGLAPFTIAWPDAPASKDIASSFTVNKDNSELPELISLPPQSIIFSGSAKMNPAGDPNHLRNNYVFGNSRFLGSVEMELPLELSFTNLQLTDTTENFFSAENSDDFDAGDLEVGKVMLTLKNGFPFDISVKMSLYDTSTRTVKSAIDVPGLLKAAPVDTGGRVNGKTESTSTIEVTDAFFDNINSSDQIIFTFRINSTGAPKSVKIYSDYGIDFGVAVFVKANFKFDL